jgi:hypothetical protein
VESIANYGFGHTIYNLISSQTRNDKEMAAQDYIKTVKIVHLSLMQELTKMLHSVQQ